MLFPVHPRTRKRFDEFGLLARFEALPNLRLIEPVGYLEFLGLMEQASLVLTDSGGIQEETTYLGVPCLTLRDNTERPVTISLGTNRLIPLDADEIAARVEAILQGDHPKGEIPPLWDGETALRIIDILEQNI